MLVCRENKKRLHALLASWSLRAKPGMPGQQGALLRDNISALESTLTALDQAEDIAENWRRVSGRLRDLSRSLASKSRRGTPCGGREFKRIANQINAIVELIGARS